MRHRACSGILTMVDPEFSMQMDLLNPCSREHAAPWRNRAGGCRRTCLFLIAALSLLFSPGCKTPSAYRLDADQAATDIIREKQAKLFGESTDFQVERPSDILRRRLLIQQKLSQQTPNMIR